MIELQVGRWRQRYWLTNIELGRRAGPPACYYAHGHGHAHYRRGADGRIHLLKHDQFMRLRTMEPREHRLRVLSLWPRWGTSLLIDLVFPGSDILFQWVCIHPASYEQIWQRWAHACCPLSEDVHELEPLMRSIELSATAAELPVGGMSMPLVTSEHPLWPNYFSPKLNAPTISIGTVLRELERAGGPTIATPPDASDWLAPWE